MAEVFIVVRLTVVVGELEKQREIEREKIEDSIEERGWMRYSMTAN